MKMTSTRSLWRLFATLAALALALLLSSQASAQGEDPPEPKNPDGVEVDGTQDQLQEANRPTEEKGDEDKEKDKEKDKDKEGDGKVAGDGKEGTTPDKPVVNPAGGPIPKEFWQQGDEPDKEGSDGVRADVVVGDPEFGPQDGAGKPTNRSPLKLEFSLRSEVHTFENADLLPLNEQSDQDIINTDDRATFAYSSIYGRANYQVLEGLEVNVALAHNGLWAEDQLGSAAQLSGVLSFGELAFIYTPYAVKDGLRLSFQIGRQPFAIGGVPRDYMLDDVLDCAVFEADAGAAGRLRVLAFDFYTANDLPGASFARYVGGREPVLGLRGDTYTIRTGAIYENEDAAVKGLTAKVYAFYADIGGGPIDETGADVSYGGSLGNFSDNDWAALFGGRAAYDLKLSDDLGVLIFAEGAHSEGLDRKEVVARDVEIAGNAFGGGLVFSLNVPKTVEVKVGGDFYLFQGAQYSVDGLEFERGFVSFKGRQVGGLNLDRYAGWHPSSYVGAGGVEHEPHNIERIAGTQFIHASASLTLFERATLSVDWWTLTDTQLSNLDLDELDGIDPPFGYSREEFAAQERAGKALGQEIDVQASYRFNGALTGYAAYGMFLPGDYYAVTIDRIVGTSLGGQETFWAATAGAEVEF